MHAIEPLRSITNRMFAGKSADCTLAVAQLPPRIASALLVDGETMLELMTPEYAPNMVAELGTYMPGEAAAWAAEKRSLE